MDLQSEVTSFKIVYGIDEETGLLDADLEQETGDDVNIGNETPEEIPNAELVYPKNSDKNGGNNKRVLSKTRNVSTNGIYSNVKALTSDVDKLLTMWKNSSSRNLNGTDDNIDGNNSRDLSDLSASSVGTSIAPSGSRLQSQLAKILELTKKDDQHEQELKTLKAKYEASEKEYLDKLTEMEISYKQSVQSLNNTHRALTLSQNELDKQRDINKKLTSELDELRLISSKKSMPGSRNITPILGRGHTPLSADKESFDDSFNNEDEADDEDMGLDARYRFKIRDLEADLVIVGQERDQLRDELIKLKKKVMMTN
ncbi:unnamed protein product [[Candida] boidinii]|nr:unnamed protein product [[Candida] boidinii]GMG20657.1 unnamed protein product [[Candida] boidinii]